MVRILTELIWFWMILIRHESDMIMMRILKYSALIRLTNFR